MEEQLKKLADLRRCISIQEELFDAAKRELESTDSFARYSLYKEGLTEIREKEQELMNDIKKDALLSYILTDKKPEARGLSLRIIHELKYDIAQVTEWCKENAKILFIMDVKAFEKMAKNVDVPGVERVDRPTITIAQDLSEYLEKEE